MKICPLMTRDLNNPIECQKEDCALYLEYTRRGADDNILEVKRRCGLGSRR